MKNLKKKLTVCFCLALLTSIGALLAGCEGSVPRTENSPYVSPYNWEGLERSGDRLAYFKQGELQSEQGVDVSEHQRSIDWNQVAADGIDFAIVSVGNRGYTEGALFVDDNYHANIDGATAAGLDVGVYFFSQAINEEEAREEADFVVKQLQGRQLDLPVLYDHEPVSDPAGRANNIKGETLASCTRAFCERLEAAGYETMIYGNQYDIARFNGASFGNRPVWLAEYDVTIPTAQFDFDMWQYTSKGQVAGIPTPVDMNIRFLAK